MKISGRVSSFGGPGDSGVAPDEGLAFIYEVEDAPHLFLPAQPPGTTGLARRLNPAMLYLACRWDYDAPGQSKDELLKHKALVRAPKTGREFLAYPADWGPNENTGRVADLSPGLMTALGIETDDEVEVRYPRGTGWSPSAPGTPSRRPRPGVPQVVVSLTVPTDVELRLTINGEQMLVDED